MTNTIYRPVPGYADLYAGMDASIVHAEKGVLEQKLYVNRKYLEVIIPGKGSRFVHALMAAAYLGPKDGPHIVVRHGEAGRLINTPDNLCYGTAADNTNDAILAGSHGALTHKSKTHCVQNHEFTPENTYSPPGTSWRKCRTCMRDVDQRRAQRKRETGIRTLGEHVPTKADAKRERISNRETRKALIVDTIKSHPELSNRAIAKQFGVGHPTIARYRNEAN